MSELKRCPFCGKRAMITTYLGTTEVDIECCDCSCKITGCNKEDAIKAWNTRKPIERIVERLEDTPFTMMDAKYVFLNKAIEIIGEEGGSCSEN